ncbi:MAG: demethoxyubiquinone hydroxylase family protein [Burkholderiaceae bacterium]
MTDSAAACVVYFDGACPLCRREIAHYRGQEGAAAIVWVDAASCESADLGVNLARNAALARLHARRADGSLVSGVAAFVMIWSRLPAYRWLAPFVSSRPVLSVLEVGYSAFLRLRPLWRRAATSNALPAAVLADLRSDHAGEAGAVQIYRGILAVARDGELRAFAARHLATELLHLRRMQQWLPASARSRLLPLWRIAGWVTGALPALLGPRAVFVTVAAVERFVDRHYAAQIERLSAHPELSDLRETLVACRHDEIAHRDDALALLQARTGAFARVWSAVVGKGSALAVAASRRL